MLVQVACKLRCKQRALHCFEHRTVYRQKLAGGNKVKTGS